MTGNGGRRRYVATHASGQVLHALDLVGCGSAYGRIALQPVCGWLLNLPPSPLLLHGVRLFRLCAQGASVRPKKLLLLWWEPPSEEPWWCGRMDIDTQS